MRFSILAAVSSRPQAADGKESLPQQEARCRAAALAHGWVETAGPFVVAGQPRTGYVNLSDAEHDIPALGACLEAARRGEYDILTIYDYTRLRDLIDLVATSLQDYGVQIYSLAQAVEPVAPDQFDPLMDDAAFFSRAGASMASRAEINALRRRFKIGMPGRVEKRGLHPLGRLPYGYRKPPGRETDRQAVPEPDPVTAPAVLAMRDLLLAGKSLPQIAAELDALGYPTRSGRPWHPDTVRRILRNPYYAGTVTFGTLRRRRDTRDGKRTRMVRSAAPVHAGPGKHQPLWDDSTQRRIQDELTRRGKSYAGRRLSRFSGLLYCSVCGRKLWVAYRAWSGHPPGDDNRLYLCSSYDLDHTRLLEQDLLPPLSARLQDALAHVERIPAPDISDARKLYQAQLVELEAVRERLRAGYKAGAIPLDEYRADRATVESQLAAAQTKLSALDDETARKAARQETLRALAGILHQVPGYIQTADPQAVNAQLRSILEKIIVTPDGEIEFIWL